MYKPYEAFSYIGSKRYREAIEYFLGTREILDGESRFWCDWWLSDCYALLGDYTHAVECYPPLVIGSRQSALTDKLLSLKLAAMRKAYKSQSTKQSQESSVTPKFLQLDGTDILSLLGPKVTKYGLAHLEEITKYINIILRKREIREGVEYLNEWAQNSYAYKYQVFIGTAYGYEPTQHIPLLAYSFSRNDGTITFVRQISREAENTVREEHGIPNVGEGWISETQLYYDIKQALSYLEVIHHASPIWLGRQHLDIFVPTLSAAIEYQGRQHDEPVEYFGGNAAFQQTQKRDAKKKKLCQKNGIRLIYVRPDYKLDEVLNLIITQSLNTDLEASTHGDSD
jgi:hypothetical protein